MMKDSISLFIKENNYTKDENNLLPIHTLYAHYIAFCEHKGYRNQLTKTTFNARLVELGFTRKMDKGKASFFMSVKSVQNVGGF